MPPEIIDPKKKELKFHNDRENRESTFKPRQRMHSIFATKPFMIGYGLFLTFFVIFLYLLQNGGIGNVFILSNFFGIGVKVETIIADGAAEDTKHILVVIENSRYKSDIIKTLNIEATLYDRNSNIVNSKSKLYNDVIFTKEKPIVADIEFNISDIAKSSRYIVSTTIDNNKVIVNKRQIE